MNIDGYEFKYVDDGEGDLTLLVHGSSSDMRSWEQQRRVFAHEGRCIAYSRRYHWPNEHISGEAVYEMEQQAQDAEHFLRELDAAPAHVVGHSYGGFLALLLAIRAPELVRTLVLAEPPVLTLYVSIPPKPVELLKLMLRRPGAALAILKFGAFGVEPARSAFEEGDDERAMRVFGDAVLGKGAFEALSDQRKSQIFDNLSNSRAELLGPGFLPLVDEDVRSIHKPTLLLNGERSIPLFRHLVDRLAELLPHHERRIIPSAGHMLHEDNAEAFNQAVISFHRRVSTAA